MTNGNAPGITYREGIPPIGEFRRLYETTGWDKEYRLHDEELATALNGSWLVIGGSAGEKLVGFGRVVTDGSMHAMIYDLIVDPGLQRSGIGTHILDLLIEACRHQHIRDIQLFCASGKQGFYERRGFVPRPPDAPWMEFVPARAARIRRERGGES